MDKFLLAENPMRPESSGLYIIHMLDPIAIIECVEGHVVKAEGDRIFKCFQFENSDGIIERWTLLVYHFLTTDFLEKPEDRVPKLLEQAWRWYRSYLEYEDKNIEYE